VEADGEARPTRALEIATLVLLPLGGVVIPLLGWLIAAALLWSSDAWTTRDKLIGTLLVPGGLGPPIYFLAGAIGPACHRTDGGAERCFGGPAELGHTAVVVVAAVWIVAQLCSVAYLARRSGLLRR
jgi:hypothetical protein